MSPCLHGISINQCGKVDAAFARNPAWHLLGETVPEYVTVRAARVAPDHEGLRSDARFQELCTRNGLGSEHLPTVCSQSEVLTSLPSTVACARAWANKRRCPSSAGCTTTGIGLPHGGV